MPECSGDPVAPVSRSKKRCEWVPLALLLLLALTRGALYVTLTPPWQAPDEPQHYQMVRLALELHRIPQRSDSESAVWLHNVMIDSLVANDFWASRQHTPPPEIERPRQATDVLRKGRILATANHPPLYYVVAALVLWPFRVSSILFQLYILRGISVLMGLATVVAVYVVGGWLSPGSRTRVWAAACLVTFLPMHGFTSASLNNDALAELLGALTFVLLASLCVRHLSVVHVIGLPVLVVLGLFTKRTDLFLVPLTVGTLLGYLWVKTKGGRQTRSSNRAGDRAMRRLVVSLTVILTAIVGVVLCDLLLCDWWAIAERLRQLWGLAWVSGVPLTLDTGFMLLGFASFWANFGWMNVPLDVGWYVALGLLSAVAALGGVKGVQRLARSRVRPAHNRCIWAICILALLSISVQAAVSVLSRQIPLQGRYLFPALASIALCFTWGVFEWVPPRYHRLLLVFWIAWWVLLDWVALTRYLLPYYYG